MLSQGGKMPSQGGKDGEPGGFRAFVPDAIADSLLYQSRSPLY